MTGYQITPSADGVRIELRGVGDRQQQLLSAFGDCQSGQCSCPTTEYEKVEALEIASADDLIAIQVSAKAGEELDTEEIASCLDHTIARVTTIEV